LTSGVQAPRAVELLPGISRFRDTCNVYVLRSGREATLIDFGSGVALDHLSELGVDRVTDVLVTHHHRDQLQGLARAVEAGIRIWVPPVERDLVEDVDRRWAYRQLDNDYDLRQDRFSLLEQVPVTGTVDEYGIRRFGEHDVYTLPTPGHTIGSVSYLVEVDERRAAFTGDLVYGSGKVWSLAATQWTYTGVEGLAATFLSCGLLARRQPDLLLPTHGEPVDDPPEALALTQERVKQLVDMRVLEPWDLAQWLDAPWDPVTPHLLRNRTSFATSYALVSDTGAALLFDFGYDLCSGGLWPATERASRRPLLACVDALRRDHGVERVEAVVVTHYHDDHVAGLNLLRDVEGTEVWATENVAPVLERPSRYDLPCLWFDPIAVDRTLILAETVQWHEYELTPHPLPGHTLYAAAIAFDVDGKRVVATGDQQSFESDGRSILNYQYRNRFRPEDYVRSAELYHSLGPDLLITGHWGAHAFDDELLARLVVDGRRVAELHRELLPSDGDFGAEGFGARIQPYRSTISAGDALELEVMVRNPFDHDETTTVLLVVPAGWSSEPREEQVRLPAHEETAIRFRVVPDAPAQRARVAADLTVGDVRFGQQAEALVDVQ
jgi:glyoxylase-like metal-dependent hydrolase (beta-lactamase superfamily II)